MKYILVAFILVACKNPLKQKEAPRSSREVLDTIKSVPTAITANPALFETAFIKGTTQKGKDLPINLYGVTIGKIKIGSGRIIACDPLHMDEYGKPYTQVFPIGEFPVQLSIAEVAGEETIVFARIKFSDAPVVKWQLALLEGQKPIAVGDEEIHGYGVDAGIGMFMDEAAVKSLTQKQLTEVEEGVYQDIIKEMHYHNDWKYAMKNIGSYNLAAFSTGLGDGRFATYIGFNSDGQPCRLVSDFKIFDWKKK